MDGGTHKQAAESYVSPFEHGQELIVAAVARLSNKQFGSCSLRREDYCPDVSLAMPEVIM